jgi:hypothetical protein
MNAYPTSGRKTIFILGTSHREQFHKYITATSQRSNILYSTKQSKNMFPHNIPKGTTAKQHVQLRPPDHINIFVNKIK